MIKKTVRYKDFDGHNVEETYYFNLTRAEVDDIDTEEKGGFAGLLNSLIDRGTGRGILSVFKKLILKSVGVKSNDGRRIIKNQDILDDFTQSDAYSEVLYDVVSSTESALTFIKGIMPYDHLAPEDKAKFDQQFNDILEETRKAEE